MYKIIIVTFPLILIFLTGQAFAQEVQLAAYQEASQIVIDQKLSNNVTSSVVLQSTSNQEIKIPAELEKKVSDLDRIVAIILTNEGNCVLGVTDDSCVMINISRIGIEGGVIAIQDTAREIGDSLIDDFNQVFDTSATFHSTYIHHNDEMNRILETSGVVSGGGTVSAVYTMPNEDTFSMYEKISAILLHPKIRESGGFYKVAKELSKDDNAKMSFSMIPRDGTSLYQLKLSVTFPNSASDIQQIQPLEFLKADSISRSDIFKDGFYPLNSLIHVVVLAAEPVKVKDIHGNILPTQIVDNEKFPADLTKAGWFFDPDQGETIDAKYLFGNEFSVKTSEILFSLGGINEVIEEKETPKKENQLEDSLVIIVIIVVLAAAAALYFLKGYKKGP